MPRTPSILAVRTRPHKLATYPDYENWTQLFDLEADPYEVRNLVGYRAETRLHVEMCQLLSRQLRETGYIERSGPDRWLIGLTDSFVSKREHARMPVDPRRPPLLHPNC